MGIIDSQSYNFESVTEEFQLVSGFTFNKNRKTSFVDLVLPTDRQKVQNALATLKDGSSIEFEATSNVRSNNIFKFNILKMIA